MSWIPRKTVLAKPAAHPPQATSTAAPGSLWIFIPKIQRQGRRQPSNPDSSLDPVDPLLDKGFRPLGGEK